MKKLKTACMVLVWFWAVAFSGTATAANNVALVVGNNAYTQAPLKNPVNDATKIGQTLTRMGFDVVTAYNADRDGFEDALATFGQKATGAEIALVYYAGHAIQVDGENYLIPVDAQVNHRRDVRKLIDLQALVDEAQGAKGLGLVMLDACRDNPFAGQIATALGRSVAGRGLARIEDTPSNILVGFATKEDQIALDGKDEHSPYAEALLNYLPQPGLEIRLLFGKVHDAVQAATNRQQQPYTYGALGGTAWYLAGQQVTPQPTTTPVPTPRPTPAPTSTPVAQPETRQPFEPDMVFIKGGTFTMGSPASEKGRFKNEGQHQVTVGDFYMGKYEVTFAEWDRCVAENGCKHRPKDEGWGRGTRPVINVSWHDAQEYVRWLNRKTGKQYRLPTEAEWEYAARGGTATARYWGDDPAQACRYGNVHDQTSKRVNEYSWEHHACDDGEAKTSPVGRYQSNARGLQDVLGNVWEWTCSAYDKNYGGAEQRCVSDSASEDRSLRGGSWYSNPRYVRSADRYRYNPANRDNYVGFRLSRTP